MILLALKLLNETKTISKLLEIHVLPLNWWSRAADQDHPGPRHAREIRHVESSGFLCSGECNKNDSCFFALFGSYNVFPSSRKPYCMSKSAYVQGNAVQTGKHSWTSSPLLFLPSFLGFSEPTKKGLVRLLFLKHLLSKTNRSVPLSIRQWSTLQGMCLSEAETLGRPSVNRLPPFLKVERMLVPNPPRHKSKSDKSA
jgi:hypothetical protein